MGRKPERTETLKRATFTLRVDQIKFLRIQGNASQVVREAIDKIMQQKVMTSEAKILQLNKRLKEVGLQIEHLKKEMREKMPGAPPYYQEPYSLWDTLSEGGNLSLEEVAKINENIKYDTLLYLRNIYNAYNKLISELGKERKNILKEIAELASA